MHRRAFLTTSAAAATVATFKSATAATVPPLGETGVPRAAKRAVALGAVARRALSGSACRISGEAQGRRSAPAGFPAFAGTMAVEHIATGFRWAEGPVYFPAGRYVLFSDIPNNRIMRLSEDDNHLSVFRQPSMNSNGNTIDRQGRLITCEHGGRRVTRTEVDGSITIIADKYNGKKLNSPNDAAVASDGVNLVHRSGLRHRRQLRRCQSRYRSRTSTTFTGWTRSPATSKWWSTISSSPTALPSRRTRRSSTSSTPASPTARTTRRTSACSTWISTPAKYRTARSLRTCPSPALPTGCAPTLPAISGARWVGAIRNDDGVRCYTPGRRTARQNPHPGDCRQFMLRRHLQKPAVYLRFDLALCRLHERNGRDEAMKYPGAPRGRSN